MTTVTVQQPDEGVALVTLDRPERLNAMNHQLVADLHEVLDYLAGDATCRVVVLTGAGRGFCSGLDLEGAGTPPGGGSVGEAPRRFMAQQHIAGLVTKLRGMRQPVIAAVNGPASGGGLALALASDLRIATPSAAFSAAFIRIGLSGCDIGVSYLLPRLIGASRAFEIMLTGRSVEADEARDVGLVSRIVDEDELLPEALVLARSIRAHSPFGVWLTKETMWSNLEAGSMRAAIDMENRTQIMATFTDDHDEAMAAWRGRRDPDFRFA